MLGRNVIILSVVILFTNICAVLNRQDPNDSNGFRRPLWERIFDQFQRNEAKMFNLQAVSLDKNQTCTVCNLILDLLITERKNQMTTLQLAAEVEYFCTFMNIENERVCGGLIKSNADIFRYIVDNQPKVNGKRICALLLQSVDCDKGDNYEWEIEIPPENETNKTKSNGTETFNILQLTDFHYDPLYTEGKKTDCGEPLCCQSDQDDATDASDSCGYWSSPKDADVPMRLIEATLNQTTSHEFEYVYFTGDLVSHRVWNTSEESNGKIISDAFDKFSEYYKVPIYPILGNHEAHPVNVFSPNGVKDETVSTQWLYDLVLKKWSWLPEAEVKETLLKGGYYTVLARKGFRVVVLNSNVCSTENWWLIFEDQDPYGQLKWLVEVLQNAEKNNEIVHILSHIPTQSCLKVWAREYKRILERFSKTVAAQFYGHSHRDQFYIYYNNNSKPINVAWNGGSLAPDKANPNYKLYTIDAAVFDVLDAETWTFNLTLANSNKHIDWYELYSLKKDYGFDSVQPEDMDKFVRNMAVNRTLIDKYYNYYYRNSDTYNRECGTDCTDRLLCEIVTTEHGEDQICKELTKK